MEDQKHKEHQSQQASQTSLVGTGKEHGLLVPRQKKQRAENLHIYIGMSVFKKCS